MLLRFFSIALLFFAIFLISIYVSRINLGEEISINAKPEIINVIGISPLDRTNLITCSEGKYYYHGYLRSLIIKTDGTLNKDEIVISNSRNCDLQIEYSDSGKNIIKVSSNKLEFLSKFLIFLRINLTKLVFVSILLIMYLAFLVVPHNLIIPVRRFSNDFKQLFNDYFCKVRKILSTAKKNKAKLLYSIISVVILLFVMRFVLGIKFEVLYFVNKFIIYGIVSVFLLIPTVGIFSYKSIKLEKRFSFFSFWIIFCLLYFFVCPEDFVGNYGFQGGFQDYIVYPLQLGFVNSLLVPDSGYIALIPHITYGLAYFTDHLGANSIAISSVISLIIYAWIFSLLCKTEFRFIIKNDFVRSFFVIFFAVFSVFSLSLSKHYALSITDVSYYGILFMLIMLMKDFSTLKWRNILLLIFISGLFVFSKAHIVVILPIYLLFIVYSFFDSSKGIKDRVFYISISVFVIIHLIYIMFSMLQMIDGPMGNVQSFTIDSKSPWLILGFSIIYFFKSYSQFIFPPLDLLSGFWGYLITFIGFLLVVALSVYAYKIYKNNNKRKLAIWFFAGNIIAFSSILFFFRTFPRDNGFVLSDLSLYYFLSQGGVSFSRYTIGVHSTLAITVLPLICSAIKDFCPRNYIKMNEYFVEIVFVVFLVLSTSIFHSTPSFNFEFWEKSKQKKWSKEWYYLSRNLSTESYYVPIIFYPIKKQQIQTENTTVIYDNDSSNNSFYQGSDNKLHSVIVLNDENLNVKYPNLKLKLFFYDGYSLIVHPNYPQSNFYKFVIFKLESPKAVKEIKFLNEKKEVNSPEHYRLIGIQDF